jgi:putative membrane protein
MRMHFPRPSTIKEPAMRTRTSRATPPVARARACRHADPRSLRLQLLAAGVVAAALATAAPHAHAAPSQTTPGAAAQVEATTHTVVHGLTADDREFMRNAAQAGHAEVIAGKLALTNARDPGVRDFGQRVMDDHMAADHKLDMLAAHFGIALPSRPDAQQQRELGRLKDMIGPDFDREFTEKLGIEAHRKTIALFRKEADAASANAAVRQFAQNTLPTLQQHLQIAGNLQAHNGDSAARIARSSR